MIFARDVDRASIQDAYRDGFEENATAADSKALQPFVDQFIGYFAKDVKEDEQFVLRWLPGGTIVAILQGEEKPPLTNALFAKTLWSFWFGEDAVVDRDDLVERIVAD